MQVTTPADVTLAYLAQLRSAGWTAVPVGDPAAPEALLFVLECGDVADSVFVKSADLAVATRQVGEEITISVDGSVAEVVGAALSWPR